MNKNGTYIQACRKAGVRWVVQNSDGLSQATQQPGSSTCLLCIAHILMCSLVNHYIQRYLSTLSTFLPRPKKGLSIPLNPDSEGWFCQFALYPRHWFLIWICPCQNYTVTRTCSAVYTFTQIFLRFPIIQIYVFSATFILTYSLSNYCRIIDHTVNPKTVLLTGK